MNANSIARLQLVHPVLSAKAYQLEQMLQPEGIEITVAQGLRSIAEQNALYAQGRTAPGRIVTNARGGYSWHNFGLAIDVYPENLDSITDAATIDWDSSHPIWQRMEAVGMSLGLESGATWIRLKDAPHFQLRGSLDDLGAPNDAVRALYAQNGNLADVWDATGLSAAAGAAVSLDPGLTAE